MKRYKKVYIVSMILITVVLTSVYFSYAFFANKNEQHGKLNVVVGDLKYKLESNDLVNNSITIPAGQMKKITLTLTSLNNISSKYEIYYNLTNSNNVEVGYLDTPASGIIGANEVINIEVGIKNKGTSSTIVTFGLETGLKNNELVINGNSLSEINLCEYESGHTWNFAYTGSEQTFTVPVDCSGTYKIETWGAEGGAGTNAGGKAGGKGAYTSGNISLTNGTNLYIYVGQSGNGLNAATFNGGGNGSTSYGSAAGGGATDVRLVNGTWSTFNSLKSRIMVAAGGGGGNSWNSVGALGADAGGLKGYNGTYYRSSTGANYSITNASGGTQTAGGTGGRDVSLNTYHGTAGSFGNGGNGYYSNGGGGGGAGYYGGGGAALTQGIVGSGASGSSFISGYSGCRAISETSTGSSITHLSGADHYSGKVFTSAVMIDGKGCDWSTGTATNCGTNQPQPDGTTTTGHSGNGYARITLVSLN